METYKLGNKINCIVRSGSSGKLGSKNMQYENQPYTVIRDVSATMQFASQNKAARAHKETQLAFSLDNVSQLRLTNVPFTKPIFDLMFDSIEEDILCNTMMNFDVDEGGALELTSLIRDYESIYQVFIYNADGELVDAEGTINKDNFVRSNDQIAKGGNFLVFYGYLNSKGRALHRQNNVYLTLDLQVFGNETDEGTLYFIHLEKCNLSMNKNLYFSGNINTVDLDFTIIPSDDDYITME